MEDKRLCRKEAQQAQNRTPFLALQYVEIIHFRDDFTTDGTDGTDQGRDASPRRPGDGRLGEPSLPANALSMKSVKSVVQLLRLRLAGLRLLCLFAAISLYCISRIFWAARQHRPTVNTVSSWGLDYGKANVRRSQTAATVQLPECVWRDAKHCARDARAPWNRPCRMCGGHRPPLQ